MTIVTCGARCDVLNPDTIVDVVHEVLVTWLLTSTNAEDARLIVRCWHAMHHRASS